MTNYDVIVVGAGPVGSTYAYKMAKQGYNVGLFDMKNRIGQPLQCAGLVSTNICDTGNLPKELIENKVKGANIHSPDNTSITVKRNKSVAYVLDRVMYDKFLFNRAVDAGVEDVLGTRVIDVDLENTMIKTRERKYSSKVIAVACGPTSQTSKKINPNLDEKQFMGVQYTVKCNNEQMEFVDLKINTSILPGFLWQIPVSPFTKRVGLFTNGSYQEAEKLLKNQLKPGNEIIEKHNGLIPRFNPRKKLTYNNTLLLGDTASQVKPTTGGGLISGFNCAEIASKNTSLMLEEQNNKYIKQYEKEYQKRYFSEFKAQQNVQNIMSDMSEDDFNYMFKQLREYEVDKVISEYGDMDNQVPLLKQLVKSGVIFKLVPKIGVRRLKNIWKSL